MGVFPDEDRIGPMPKLKSKSSVKKRFSTTGSGKLRRNYAGKRHFMRRRTKRFLRTTRGTAAVSQADAKMIRRLLAGG